MESKNKSKLCRTDDTIVKIDLLFDNVKLLSKQEARFIFQTHNEKMCGKLKWNKQTDGQTQRKAIDPSAETDSSPITALSFNTLPRGADNGVPYAARQL